MFRVLFALVLVASSGLPVGGDCGELARPVHGPLVRGFAPIGSYGGHWGVDFEVPSGTVVRAGGAGEVTFAGSVAGRLSVTVAHGGGLRTSYSYLSEVLAAHGAFVELGDPVGLSGAGHHGETVHWSVRIADRYVDPIPWLACRFPGGGVSLLPTRFGTPNLPRRAKRHSRGYLRSPTYRTSDRRRSRLSGARVGRRHVHARRRSMAESRARPIGSRTSVEDDEPGGRWYRLLRGR